MKASFSKRLSLALLIPAAALAFACSKEATPTAEQPKPPIGNTPTEVTPATVAGDKSGTEPAAAKEGDEANTDGVGADVAGAKPSYAETNFTLGMKASGSYKAGQEGSVEIVLEAKAPFHANDKYPYKFKVAETAGVTFPEPIVKKDKAKVEHMSVSMPVAFTGAAAGKKKISGVFHFSVCTDDKCLIEKRALALEVDVK